jgi:hypothetical protein
MFTIYSFGSLAQARSVSKLLPRVFPIGGASSFSVEAKGENGKRYYVLSWYPSKRPSPGAARCSALDEHYATSMTGWVRGYLYASKPAR